MSYGGYDEGYQSCSCFWGPGPGRLVKQLENIVSDFSGVSVLDVGCGEGKNAIFLARKGAKVTAIDISEFAVRNALNAWDDHEIVKWEVGDIRNLEMGNERFDVVIAYGLYHCLGSFEEIRTVVEKLGLMTKQGGYHLVCAFNSRMQQLEAHPGFVPILLTHAQYLDFYKGWRSIFESDEVLTESHPNNNIRHSHSLTRIIVSKR